MSTASRKQRKAEARNGTAEPYFKEPKRPTRKYVTKAEEQERRANAKAIQRELDARIAGLAASLMKDTGR